MNLELFFNRFERIIIIPIKRFIYNFREYNYLIKLKKSAKRTKDLVGKTVIINSFRIIRNNLDIEGFFGMILALNGAKVKILLDDGILTHWDTIQIDNWHSVPPKLEKIEKFNLNPYYNYFKIKNLLIIILKKIIIKKALKAYKVDNLEYVYYSDIVDRKKLKYENLVELKKYAEASAVRFFRNCDLDYNDKYVKYYFNLSIMNGIISRNVGEYILNKLKPDYFVTSHGLYTSDGPMFEFLKNSGVNVRLWFSFLYSNEMHLVFTDVPFCLSNSTSWRNYKQKPVTEGMRVKVQEYFENRFSFTSHDTPALMRDEGVREFKVDKNDGYKYHIAVFPQVIWDLHIKDRFKVFDGYLDWLISTINYVKNRKDIKLYIKAHPMELMYCINTPKVLDLLNKYLDLNKFENITYISSEERINTYGFLKSGIDLGITHDGTLAFEMPYLNIPAIMCVKDGFSSVEGGNFIANDRVEYFNYLDNIDKVIAEFHSNYEKYKYNIIRYIYWMNYEARVDMPHVYSSRSSRKFDLMQLTEKSLILNKIFKQSFN